MKKNLIVIGAILAALVMVFAGCQNGAQEVEGDVGRYTVAHGPSVDASKIDVKKWTGGNGRLIGNFVPANNASGYVVYASPDKKVLEDSINAYLTIGYSLDADGVTYTPLWTAAPEVGRAYFVISGIPSNYTDKYYIGIQAYDELGNAGKIQWSKEPVSAY